MPRGGPRPGAGRKKGSTSNVMKARRAEDDLRVELGYKISDTIKAHEPLDVLERAALTFLQLFEEEGNTGHLEKAAQYANMAAPYRHKKMPQQQETNVTLTAVQQMSDEELQALLGPATQVLEAEVLRVSGGDEGDE